MERWKPVKGFSDYECSTYGNVRRIRKTAKGITCCVLKQTIKQYRQIRMQQKQKRYCVYIHRLVLDTFGPAGASRGSVVRFLDGDKLNCRIENLEYIPDTRKKLNFKLAEEIRQLYKTSQLTYEDLADRYDVTATTIGDICRCEAWKRP